MSVSILPADAITGTGRQVHVVGRNVWRVDPDPEIDQAAPVELSISMREETVRVVFKKELTRTVEVNGKHLKLAQIDGLVISRADAVEMVRLLKDELSC